MLSLCTEGARVNTQPSPLWGLIVTHISGWTPGVLHQVLNPEGVKIE